MIQPNIPTTHAEIPSLATLNATQASIVVCDMVIESDRAEAVAVV